MYSEREQGILKRYVTDPEGNIYAIHNLPEEVIAVIFAYVSRSPRSFRDNLLELIAAGSLDLREAPDRAAGPGEPAGQHFGAAGGVQDEALAAEHREAQERARRFHEKWVVGYGHNSVAEHAVAHVGVERISRLASAELELANPYLSFTEYSQRYQRPLPGGFVTPADLDEPGLAGLRHEFAAFCQFAFERYEALQSGLLQHLEATLPQQSGESAGARKARLEKLSFEDARYALPLAVHSNLGLTGNGRALRDALVRLSSSPLPEVRALAADVKREVSRILPALVRHADPSPYWQAQQDAGVVAATRAAAATGEEVAPGALPSAGQQGYPGEARLLDYTGRDQGSHAAATAAQRILTAWLARRAGLTAAHAEAHLQKLQPAERWDLYRQAAEAFGDYDIPGEEFRQVRYTAEFAVSEANWHQLLRHSRKVAFYPAPAGTAHGYTVPPRIQVAGLAGVLAEVIELSEALVARLSSAAPGAAAYAVTNAHRRTVLAEFDLWEWVHLARQRCKPDAQWDIRETVWQLADQIESVHAPLLAPLGLPQRTTA